MGVEIGLHLIRARRIASQPLLAPNLSRLVGALLAPQKPQNQYARRAGEVRQHSEQGHGKKPNAHGADGITSTCAGLRSYRVASPTVPEPGAPLPIEEIQGHATIEVQIGLTREVTDLISSPQPGPKVAPAPLQAPPGTDVLSIDQVMFLQPPLAEAPWSSAKSSSRSARSSVAPRISESRRVEPGL